MLGADVQIFGLIRLTALKAQGMMTLDTLAVPLRHPQLLLHRLPLRLVPVPRSLHLVKPRLVFLATVTNISCMTQMVGLSSLFHLYLSLSLLLLFFFFFQKITHKWQGSIVKIW